MRLIRKKIFIAVLLLCCPLGLYAQLDSELRRHVIIAIDQYPTQNSGTNKLDSISATTVTPLLRQYLDSLLTDSDYVSVVHYGIGTQDSSFAKYATCATPWENFFTFRQRLNSDNWLRIAQNKGRNRGKCFSMMTGAKFYSFLSLFGKNVGKQNNKIYLLMITDNQYNGGGDIDAEYVHFEGLDSDRNPNLSRADFFKTCLAVSEKYNFKWLGRKIIIRHKSYPYQLVLFEVIPNDRPSLPSAVIYPANLGLHRVRGGYELNFDYSSALSSYKLKKLEIEVPANLDEKKLVVQEHFAGERGHVHIFIDKKHLHSKTLNVTMRVWLVKEDSIYSGLVLSPYDSDKENLTIRLELPLKDDAMILGLLPMPDELWWWFPTDQSKAVLPWDIIVVLLFVVLVIFVSYKTFIWLTRYVPNNSDLHITNV